MCYALLIPVLSSLNCSFFFFKLPLKCIVINLYIGLLFGLMINLKTLYNIMMPDSD